MKTTIYTALAVTGLSLTLLGAGVVSFAHNLSPAEKTALINGDFNGYKSAITESAKLKADNLTQEDFTKLSTKVVSQEAVKKAIEEGNYENFKKSADTRMLARITNQTEFDKLVTETKAIKVIQDKVIQAIKDNNFEAFKAAQTEMKTYRDANHPNNTGRMDKHNYTPTEAEMKSRFDSMVTSYKANGTLPENSMMGKGFKGGFHNR
jgi:hypothetical protein